MATKRPTEVVIAERRKKLLALERRFWHRKAMLENEEYPKLYEAYRALEALSDWDDSERLLEAAQDFVEGEMDSLIAVMQSGKAEYGDKEDPEGL